MRSGENGNSEGVCQFGPFRFDFAQRILLRDGQEIALKPKTLELLEFFLKQNNEIVSKETLMEHVWAESFVEDANLTVHVSKLRKIFANSDAVLIETFPKRGYRFVADIRSIRDIDGDAKGSSEEIGRKEGSAITPGKSPRDPHKRAAIRLAAGVMAILSLLSLSAFVWLNPKQTDRSHIEKPITVALVPIDAGSLKSGDQYLGTGLTDNLERYLSEIPSFHLIKPDPKVFQHSSNESEIAELAGARLVIKGSVEERLGQFVVSLKCYDRDSDSIILEKNFLQNGDEFQKVEGKIVNELLASIGIQDPRGPWTPLTRNQDAYHYFLKGRDLRLKMGNNNLRASLPLFKQAYTADPDFALAYASTGEVYHLLANNGGADPATVLPLAKAALNRALALDNSLAEAWIDSAAVKTLEWDWNGADADFRKALELSPFSVKAHRRYARFLALRREFAGAFDHIRAAKELDPMSVYLKKQEAVLYIYAGQYDEAWKIFSESNDLDHDDLNNFELGWISALRGQYTKAASHFETSVKEGPTFSCYYAYALAMSGQRGRARSILRDVKNASPPVSPAIVAFIPIGLGEYNEAIRLIEEAYENKDIQLIFLLTEGFYEPLFDNPRFREICEKVGLPEPPIRNPL